MTSRIRNLPWAALAVLIAVLAVSGAAPAETTTTTTAPPDESTTTSTTLVPSP